MSCPDPSHMELMTMDGDLDTGTAVSTPAELGAAVQAHRVGDSVSVTWIDAAGATHTAAVTLVAGPPA